MSITECAAMLRRREISAAELTERMLKRIAEKDEIYGAYLTVTADTARQQAADADRRLLAGSASLLCGIPYGLKDNFMTAGIRSTCGAKILENYVPPFDAAVYERLQEAGAVLLGKNNMDAFAMGSGCEKSAFHVSRNPMDPTRTPGGSSGGSAAAVAAGEALFAIGTDTGGSARQPAAFCGLVSMKPTYGRISRYGLAEFASSMDTVCPITRTVEDNAYVYAAIAGPDSRDMTAFTDKVEENTLRMDIKGMRIGVAAGYASLCDEDTVRCTERAVKRLAEIGASVEEVNLPETEHALEVYVVTAAAEASSNMARYDGIRYGSTGQGGSYSEIVSSGRTAGLGEEVIRRILAGTFALSSLYNGDYYRKVKAARAEINRLCMALTEKYDAILMPTTVGTAFSLDAYAGDPTAMYGSDRFTVYANLTGMPAIQLPSGGDGVLPCGISLMGAYRSEEKLYGLAYALEEALAADTAKEVGDVL